jgi:hypothetical protein
MADNIQDPNDVRRRQNPDDPQPGSTEGLPGDERPEGTTGREPGMPRRDENVPGDERDRDVIRRPDERRDEGEFGGDEVDG